MDRRAFYMDLIRQGIKPTMKGCLYLMDREEELERGVPPEEALVHVAKRNGVCLATVKTCIARAEKQRYQ